MQETVIIIGGGLAGLAAAVALAEHNVAVTLFESRPRLGGRAASFVDQTTGTRIDNCQHVNMGCCTNFQHFCRTLGVEQYFRCERELYFIGRDGIVNRFSANRLPAPLHLAGAFRRLSYLNSRDKRKLASGLREIARPSTHDDEAQTIANWLELHGQTPATIERFWKVVLVSALSENLDRISVPHARKVFVDAFLSHRQGWEVQIPRVPLDEIYGSQLVDWLQQRNATIRVLAGVERLVPNAAGDAIDNIQLRDGQSVTANDYILAIPQQAVAALLPEELQSHPVFQQIEQIESAPIASVHLWFDRPIMNLPHAVLIERQSQWVFNRTELMRAEGVAPSSSPSQPNDLGFYYQVVISAARNLEGRSQAETIDAIRGELAEIWPEAATAELVHARVVTEHRAVFSVTPGIEELRPQQQSPLGNLQLAGDWTCTGWPATMESAVRSGYLAAENVLQRLGRPCKLIQPNLPTSLLSKILFGL